MFSSVRSSLIRIVSPGGASTGSRDTRRTVIQESAGLLLYGVMNGCFRLHTSGLEHLPPSGPFVISANYVSDLDAMAQYPSLVSEGWRSPDGRLQRFLPGIGQLLLRTRVPVVPAWIEGAYEALPRGHRVPRLRRIRPTFGATANVEEVRKEGIGRPDKKRIANALRSRVSTLSPERAARSAEQAAYW